MLRPSSLAILEPIIEKVEPKKALRHEFLLVNVALQSDQTFWLRRNVQPINEEKSFGWYLHDS
jgi:hypothetical protein